MRLFSFLYNTFGSKQIHTRIRKKAMFVLVRRLSLYYLFVTSPEYWSLIMDDIFQKPTPFDHIICHIRLCCPTLKYHHLSPSQWITSSPIVVLRSWWSPVMPNFLIQKLALYNKYFSRTQCLTLYVLYLYMSNREFQRFKILILYMRFFQPMHFYNEIDSIFPLIQLIHFLTFTQQIKLKWQISIIFIFYIIFLAGKKIMLRWALTCWCRYTWNDTGTHTIK